MINVTFNSRGSAITLLRGNDLSEHDMLFISINTTQEDADEMMGLIAAAEASGLTVVFKDDEVGMTVDDADFLVSEIFDAIMDENVKNFYVHCDAGISRSGAVAKFINDYYGLGEDHPILGRYRIYNKHVYTSLVRAQDRLTSTD